jgi:hypothetical protein
MAADPIGNKSEKKIPGEENVDPGFSSDHSDEEQSECKTAERVYKVIEA